MSRRRCAVLLCAALAVTACADEGSSPAPTSTPPANTTTTTAAPPDTTSPAPDTTTTTTTVPPGPPEVDLVPVAEVELAVDLAVRPGDDTLYVALQSGEVVAVRDGAVAATVLDLGDRTEAGGERGLLGLAFHPTEPFAYVNHTDQSGTTVIAEYQVEDDGTFRAGSRRELLTVPQPYPNHNGGAIAFGPDGMLYIGMGDGGSANDPERHSLDLGSLLGKILRIDPRPEDGHRYAVPGDNPFLATAGARPEIWAIGVRNPWRMRFDRLTGDLWFGDVGQNEWEEIDVAWADEDGGRGANFGWSAWEGSHRFNTDQPADGATAPIHEYPHGELGCSVSGGARYRGAAVPALVGWYVFADYCSGLVTALRVDGKVVTEQAQLGRSSRVSAVAEGPDGELYVLSQDAGVLAVRPRG